MPRPASAPGLPGILYYDPNPTTSKLATASLRIAGYSVHAAETTEHALELAEKHQGDDNSLVALMLDASADPKATESLLASLAKLPEIAKLPAVLMVSRQHPTPIPAANNLPTLRRPFSSPALLRVVRDTVGRVGGELEIQLEHSLPPTASSRIGQIVQRILPEIAPETRKALLDALLDESSKKPDLLPGFQNPSSLQTKLEAIPIESVLGLLGEMNLRGVLTVEDTEHSRVAKLHLERSRIRLAEYQGNDEDLKLGRFVIEASFMRSEELEAFIVGRDPESRPLGQRLVDGGFLTLNDLASVLIAQAREVSCHLLTWKRGDVRFEATHELQAMAQTTMQPGVPEITIAEALLVALRRKDDTASMGPHMPVVDDVFIRVDDQIAKIEREHWAQDELQVLEQINGRNNVKEIARRTRTGTFAVARVLYRLCRAKAIRLRTQPAIG